MKPALDLVGIGALNEDYTRPHSWFARALPRARDREIENRREIFQRAGAENTVSSALTRLGLERFVVSTGGSAFNVVRTVRSIDPSLRCGFVGVLGGVQVAPFSADLAGIDQTFLRPVPGI